AGLPLVQCLEILGQQQDNPFFGKVLSRVREDVESGSTLADAMGRHPKVFEQLYVNMVEAGETGGILDIILQRLSTFLEKMVKLKSDVKSALIYPIAVISISIIVISVIMIFVIPSFKSIFESLVGPGEGLPWLTQFVVNVSVFMGNFWWLIAIVLGLIAFGLKYYYKTPKGRKVLDGLMLRIPIIGEILRKIAISRFSRTLGTLLSSGVPILESLDITARTSGNVIVEEAILNVRAAIEQGETFLEPLKAAKIFPPMVCQMIGIGEQTGALDAMLSKIADFYEQEVDAAIANLLAMLEPAMILFLGVTIGTIVIAMYLPLFSLIAKLSKH
ncbi:MAG TPA: type II secretion system F family protein, partial [Blastocatellia bacterium]|nr:type II secretion system F family protein [Blastocatellia bacterium]